MFTYITLTEDHNNTVLHPNEVLARQGNRCFYCERPLRKFKTDGKKKTNPTRDHLFPRSHGFGLCGNMVISCEKCNVCKGDRLPNLDEVLKAFKLVYSRPNIGRRKKPLFFICEIRYGKPVVRLTS